MASRTVLLPRKLKLTLETPPEIWRQRKSFFQFCRRQDKGAGIVVMFFDAGRDREDIRIENNIFGRESCFFGQQLISS